MKKLLSISLVLVLALALTACCCVNIPKEEVPTIDSIIKDNSPTPIAPIAPIPEEMMPTEVDNSAIEEYVEANRDLLIGSMESSFAGSSGMTCSSDIYVEGMGFVIILNINELDELDEETKQMMQDIYDGMDATFEEALTTFQTELPDLEYFEVQVCEVDGDLIATILAGEK